MYMSIWPASMCTMYMPGALRGQKWVLDILQPGLQAVVTHHVYAGNQTHVLCKNSKCS